MAFIKKDVLDLYSDFYKALENLEKQRNAVYANCDEHSPEAKICTKCFIKSCRQTFILSQAAHTVLADLEHYVLTVNQTYEILTKFLKKSKEELQNYKTPPADLLLIIEKFELVKTEYLEKVKTLNDNQYLNTAQLEWNKGTHD